MSDITNRQQLIHLHSETVKELLPEQINFGEIAVQYAADEPLLYIKDSNENIVSFIDSNKIEYYINDIVSAITENEFVVASALVDLDTRVTDINSALTKDEYVISMALNDLNLRIENCADQSDLEELQEIIGGGALDDRYVQLDTYESFTGNTDSRLWNLENNISNLSSSTRTLSSSTVSALNALSSAMGTVLTQYATSANVHSTIDWLKNELIEDELVIAAAFNDISERVSAITETMEDSLVDFSELYATSADVHSALEDIVNAITDDEFIVATSVNDINARLNGLGELDSRLNTVENNYVSWDVLDDELDSFSNTLHNEFPVSASVVSAIQEVVNIIIDNEYVTATALNDLNTRIASCPTSAQTAEAIQTAILDAGNY